MNFWLISLKLIKLNELSSALYEVKFYKFKFILNYPAIEKLLKMYASFLHQASHKIVYG